MTVPKTDAESEFEEVDAEDYETNGNGAPAPPVRVAAWPWDDADGHRALWEVNELKPLPKWARSMLWNEKKDKQTQATFYVLQPCEANVTAILRNDRRWKDVLALDDMAHRITTVKVPPWHETEPGTMAGSWGENDPSRLVSWLQQAYRLKVQKWTVESCVAVVADDRRFHPVKAWLESLPAHDGNARVETFFAQYFGAKDTEYTRAVGRVLLVSMVARAMVAACKADTIVCLEGEQGLKKSTACKVLAGDEFFGELSAEIGTKDGQLAMHGKWLIELPELSAMGKSMVETVKAFLSRAADWIRPPYARTYSNLKRSSVCIATTNDKHYLKDTTGNRRWLPIKCTAIDSDAIARDRDQLFAEALAMYRTNCKWWIDDPSVLAMARAQTEMREEVDPWTEKIRDWVRGGGPRSRGEAGVTTSEALDFLRVPIERQTDQLAAKVGTTFRRLGMVMKRPYDREAERLAAERGETYQRPRIFMWPNLDADDEGDE